MNLTSSDMIKEPRQILRTMSNELQGQNKEYLRPMNILIPESNSLSVDQIDLDFSLPTSENLPPRSRQSSQSGSIDLVFTSHKLSYPGIMIPETRTKTPRSPSLRSLKSNSTESRGLTISPTDHMFSSHSHEGKFDVPSPSHLLMERYKSRGSSITDFEVY
mmetsp:Transcript_25247/g.27558  ORF Transcript_25247/g.27558 Transcript_25247/m.27558 type:complete len:161 (+) Transcript_25247:137-619(+)